MLENGMGLEKETKQFIVVNLGNEQYGIDIQYVDNIVRMQKITRVPKAQDYFNGIINLRGEIIPVMSLRLKFDLEKDVFTPKTRMLILKIEQAAKVGIIVDEVKEVVTLEVDTIEKNNYDNTTDEKGTYLTGIGKHNDTLISILNIASVIIEKENAYMKAFGLGEPTGIELPEKIGVLAGPDYRSDNGLDPWAPGDTLQASIGQSDNLFSPLQITMYVSTLINNGTRYSAHILYKVCPYGSDEPSYVQESKVIEKMDISEQACSVVKNAMRDVIENGSASEMFEDYPLTIGGKTGTAQVSKVKSDNAIFTAFAPFDDPELVVTCVIEQGNTGANAGVSVKGLFDYYFELDKVEDNGGADE